MNPDLFKIVYDPSAGHGYISTYLTLLYVGAILFFLFQIVAARSFGLLRRHLALIALLEIYLGLLFSKIFNYFLDGSRDMYLAKFSQMTTGQLLIAFTNPFGSGRVLYGAYFGVALGLVLMFLLIYRDDINKLGHLFDLSALGLLIVFSCVRLGCTLQGCCYGLPSEAFGIKFAVNSVAYHELISRGVASSYDDLPPLIPTQLYEMIFHFSCLLIFFYIFTRVRIRLPFFYAASTTFLYALFRFFIEFLRFDIREYIGPLSISQWIALLLIPPCLWFFFRHWETITALFRKAYTTPKI